LADDLTGLGTISIIYRIRPDWSNQIEQNYALSNQLLSFPGSVQDILSFVDQVPRRQSFDYVNVTPAETKEILDFYAARKGRVEKFWLPGYRAEFTLSQNVPMNSTVLYVEDNSFDLAYQGYERVYILLQNGDMITRKIIAVIPGPGAGKLTLQLDTITDRAITIADIQEFGRLYLVRFDKDQLEFAHKSSQISSTKIEFAELTKEYPA